jgi:type IV pilus biogenesis protein CpaD/CtpE
MQRGRTSGLVSAILLPLASLLLLRRQRLPGSVRLLSGMLVFAAMAGLIAGCAGQGPDATPSTPAGQSTVTINATSGTAVQQTTVSLTVQ